ncbi:MAG: hypothetical protein ACREXX_08070 [Gammaproteobacteria bacterium]
MSRREIIDEFGWRNFGEIWVDHETTSVSHHNNQYDFLYGTLLQYWRTGDPRWRALSDPPGRHVADNACTDRRLVAHGAAKFS